MHLLHDAMALIEPSIAAYGALAVFVFIYFEALGSELDVMAISEQQRPAAEVADGVARAVA